VGNYLSGNLAVSLISTQMYDSGNGLVEQWMQLTNTGSSPVASARVAVTGLLTNMLFNAAGTNNGNPFVIYGSTLNPGKSANMLLQFFALNYFAFNNSQLQPFATSLANLSPPANLFGPTSPYLVFRSTTTNFMFGGTEIAYFWSVPGLNYTLEYSDNPQFANPLVMLPISRTAGANQILFYDNGPPATVSFPTNNAPRYYRMYINP
jgi:hypothetical protein